MIDIAQTLTELTALPIHDRPRVVESLWDSIPANSPVDISPEQRAELQQRIAAHERSPEQLLTWDEVLDRLRDSR
ncbi:MAG: addiction module protein [Planctomycetes bacterium]|nr:addiction module protein [Planctomycetota bacterium]